MLHIVTLAYRFELLSKVYASIPKHDDIRWHLSIAKERGLPTYDFLKNDNRIIVHLIDCKDNDFVSKRNAAFENIHDGYFYLLDDDTIFLNEAYEVYRHYKKMEFRGMIIGDRIFRLRNYKGEIERAPFPTENPATTFIDTGMAIASSDVLRSVKWEWVPENEICSRDQLFWTNCFKYFGKEKVVFCNRVIAYYNYSAPILRLKRKIFNRQIELKIYNPNTAYIIEFIAKKIKMILK